MKLSEKISLLTSTESLPVRGAWIETQLMFENYQLVSLPVRGAWIETCDES